MQAKRHDVVTIDMSSTEAHTLFRLLEYVDEHGSINQDESELAVELLAQLNSVL